MRSGQATAAPVATGMPWPMAPPVRVSQSWGGHPAVAPATNSPAVLPSSETMAPSGSSAPRAAAIDCARRAAPVGASGRAAAGPGDVGRRAERVGQRRAGPPTGVVGAVAEHVDLAALGHEVAGLARVGEERHRRLGVDQDQVLQPVQLHLGELGQVAEPLDRGQPGAPARAGPGRSRTAAWRPSPAATRAAATSPASPQRPGRRRAARPARRERRTSATTAATWSASTGGRRRGRDRRGRARAPRTTTRRPAGSGWRPGPGRTMAAATASAASAATSSLVARGADPARAARWPARLDVALERRVVLLVVGGVVADDVHDRREAPAGVVEVGQAVAEARARGAAASRPACPAMRA